MVSKLVKLCTPRLAKNWIFLHQSAWKTVGMFFENLRLSIQQLRKSCTAKQYSVHCVQMDSNGYMDQKLICTLLFTPSSYESSSHSGFTCFCPFHISTCFHMVKNYMFFFSMVNSHFFSWFLKLLTHPQMVQSWLWHTAKQRHGRHGSPTGMRRRAEKIVCVCFLQNSDLMYSRIYIYIYIYVSYYII